MAKLFGSISTTERIRARKSAIPSILELDTLDVFHRRFDFEGSVPAISAPAGGATQDAEARTAIGSIITAIQTYPGGVGQFQSTASGAVALVAAGAVGVANGVVRLDPGTDNAGRSDLSLGRHFTGSRNAHVWWKILTPSTIASFKFECGFTDVLSGTDAGAVNVKATPTFTADDAVVLIFDTDNDTNLSLLGVAATVAATKINLATALLAATEYYLGIELRDGAARGYLLDATGKLLEYTAWMTGAVTSTVLLTPWAFVQNRSASRRLLDIDMLDCYQRRSATA